ncbi:hypothetical protein DL766_004442 [Monosporascus sp. MC13-8B]|uniref:ABC1 atypical kinase-like domain-containing protein n=1 Tax=Monosporascus cannonballus TaxID=155416 RepID=A0ABY0H2E5_9PEZI|nr:hypothetical protein DL762_006276 [Monosporascus cannonballus]RYP01367.1 hypothetical protein DL763_000177 [Monosporascus cannonballus]RYP31259.1 hypothetical protein DL766_004442 [Monosporascus sp. MC13-8B]
MKALSSNFLNRLASNGRWTCSNCRNHILAAQVKTIPRRPPAKQYTAGSSRNYRRLPKSPRTRITVLTAAATGAAGAGALAFTDEIKYGYEAAERTGRVAAALGICINEYAIRPGEPIYGSTAANLETQLPHLLKPARQDRRRRGTGPYSEVVSQEMRGAHIARAGEKWRYIYQARAALGNLASFSPITQPGSCSPTNPSIERDDVSAPLRVDFYMFRGDTGEDLKDYFSEFAEEPIGAASLAQVHLATVKETSQRVAVKVQHPGLALWAPLDLALTKFTFSTLKKFFPEYDLEWLSSEMEVSLPQELDFQQEAANAIRTQKHFAQLPELPLVIPNVIWAKKRILVMANESGRRLDDLDYLDSNNIDRDEVSAALARIFNEMIFGKNAPLHCDPHGGNIAIRKTTRRRPGGHNFEVILYDHGLYRDIPESLRRSYAKMWLAVIDGDMKAMQKYTHEVAGVTEEQFPLFASAITGRDFSVVSTSILRPRSAEEKTEMGDALREGLLSDLVGMLGQVPRIILLILKTNDLTRSLDESLRTRDGPTRGFLILARYCARTVLRERADEARAAGAGPRCAVRLLGAWLAYFRLELKLGAFELWLTAKRVLGLKTPDFAAELRGVQGLGG